jgi:hypothetical protein
MGATMLSPPPFQRDGQISIQSLDNTAGVNTALLLHPPPRDRTSSVLARGGRPHILAWVAHLDSLVGPSGPFMHICPGPTNTYLRGAMGTLTPSRSFAK